MPWSSRALPAAGWRRDAFRHGLTLALVTAGFITIGKTVLWPLNAFASLALSLALFIEIRGGVRVVGTAHRDEEVSGPAGWAIWKDGRLLFERLGVERRKGQWLISDSDLFEGIRPPDPAQVPH